MTTSELETKYSSDDVEKCCDQCKLYDKGTATIIYCRTCKQFQSDSDNSIDKLLTLAKHSVVDVEDRVAEKGESDVDKCDKHDKLFMFNCEVDNKFSCSTSAIISHIDKCGRVDDIDNLIHTNKEELQKIKCKIQDQKITSTKLALTGSGIKSELRNDQADKLQMIDEAKDIVMQMFDSFKTEFNAKTDYAIGNIEVDIDIHQTTLVEIDKQRDAMETCLDNMVSEGNHRKIATALDIYNKLLDQFDARLEHGSENLSTLNIDLRFHEQLVMLLDITEKIGEIRTEKIKFYEPLELHEAAAVDIKGSGEDSKPLLTGLDFMVDGRIAAVDNRNDKCIIMNEQLSVLSYNTLEFCPHDITVMSGNQIAVSSLCNLLSTYTVNQDNTLTKLNTIKTTSKLFSLCTLDDETLVASTFHTEGPAKKVSLTGEETDFNLPWETSTYWCNDSKTTYIPSLDMLVLTDKEADRCYLWDVKEGRTIVVEDERIRRPREVCATTSGIIFLCSDANRSIVQISPAGKILPSTYLSYVPYSVAVSHDDKLLLVFSPYGAKTLQLFNI